MFLKAELQRIKHKRCIEMKQDARGCGLTARLMLIACDAGMKTMQAFIFSATECNR
jgi:hypothetical protein